MQQLPGICGKMHLTYNIGKHTGTFLLILNSMVALVLECGRPLVHDCLIFTSHTHQYTPGTIFNITKVFLMFRSHLLTAVSNVITVIECN